MRAALERLTPRQRSYAAAAGIALVSLAAGYGLSTLGENGEGGGAGAGTGCEDVLYWYDPMVPGQQFDEPGKSPFMDMQLVPKCAGGDAQGAEAVSIDPALVQNFGIRTAQAEYGVLEPETTVTGTLAYNGSEVAIVQPRAGGYVQRTYGHAPQDVVARGAPIADLLVPEWGGAQQEYLAVAATGDEALASAARERLRLLGMPDAIISSVARSGRPQSTITVTAPQPGAITSLGVRPGMTVAAGQTLAEISGYSPHLARGSGARGIGGQRPRRAAGERHSHRVPRRTLCRPDRRHPAERTGCEPDDHRSGPRCPIRACGSSRACSRK